MYAFPLIDGEELAGIRHELTQLQYVDGKATAKGLAREAKNNQQSTYEDPRARELLGRIQKLMVEHRSVQVAAFPRQLRRVMINRYDEGEEYDWHVDRSLMGTVPNVSRTDLSFTLFLTPPEEYDGGELVIEIEGAQRTVKLPAGHIVIYPTYHLHKVSKVTRGSRVSCVGWIESCIPDPLFRDTLWRLSRYMGDIRGSSTPKQIVALREIYERLVKLGSH